MHDPKTYTNAYGGQVDAFWYISLRKMNQSCFYRYFKGYGLGIWLYTFRSPREKQQISLKKFALSFWGESTLLSSVLREIFHNGHTYWLFIIGVLHIL